MNADGRLGMCVCAVIVAALNAAWPTPARAADCNGNGVEDAQDISGGTSQDCDVNGVPDECQPDTDGDGTIDACDDCGTQLTDNNIDEFWSIRQSSTSRGNVLWFDANDDVYYYDGSTATLIQPRNLNNVDLEGVANFVFMLGSGANPGEVLAAWRRGTDFAWIWGNDGQDPRDAVYTNPYDPNRTMNPEDVAIADGCIFMLLQASDPVTSNLTLHVFRIDPPTGSSTLLTVDFLNVTQNGGSGALVNSLVTSGCKAAWSWCSEGNAGTCTVEPDLHYYDGTSTVVLDTQALALDFARGRLLYSKPVNGVVQLFLFDTNLPSPAPVQLTSFGPADKQIIDAQTDGRNVAILVGDAGGQNREIVLLGGLPLSDAGTSPADSPPSQAFPFQLDRGQLLWTAQDTSVVYYNGSTFQRVCSYGWLNDGYVAQLRKTSATGNDTEVFLFTGTPPDDAKQPSAPLLVQATASGNGEATVSWSTVLGATAYNVYFARESGVTPSSYQTLAGSGAVTGVTENRAVIGNLAGDQVYFFVVTAVEDSTEGPPSAEVTVMPCVDPALDGDGDGTPDCVDGCPNDPDKTAPGTCGCGVPETPDCPGDLCPDDPNKTEPGVCGCGVPDSTTDTDGDGTPDCVDLCPDDANKTDPGACGCGVPETPDCPDDLCPNDPNKTEPGVCGCGVPDVDDNHNGTLDCLEDMDGGTPGDSDQQGCAPGLCGPGVAPILPLLITGVCLMRRIVRRGR